MEQLKDELQELSTLTMLMEMGLLTKLKEDGALTENDIIVAFRSLFNAENKIIDYLEDLKH